MHNQNMKIDMLAPIPFRPRRSPRWSSIEVVEDGVWGLVRKREFPLSAAAESPAFGPFLGAWKEAALRGETLTLDRLTPLWTEPRDVGLHLIEVRDGMPDAWIFVRFDVRVTSHGRDFTGRRFGDYPIPFIRAATSNDLYTAATLRRPSLIEVMCPIGRYLRLMLPVHQPAGDRLFLLSVVQILAVGGPRRIEPMLAEAGPPRPGLMSDLDLLAWVVGVTVPESMARNLAAALLSRFGDLGDVLRASPEALAQVQGASAGLHPLFQASVELARRAIRTEVGVRAFANRFTFIDYVTVCFAHSRVEELWAFALDGDGRLLREERLERGTVHRVNVNEREIVRLCIETSCAAIVLAHNHPSGDPRPSAADVATTEATVQLLDRIGVALVDHLIVSRGGVLSMRERDRARFASPRGRFRW